MRYKADPEDFVVEERIRLSLTSGGPFGIYRVRKRDVTTLSVQAQMARALGRPHSAVIFPALKDRHAVAVQHAAVRGGGPQQLSGSRFTAELLGYASRPLTPRDVEGNRFVVVLRDLGPDGPARVAARVEEVSRFGMPNYFDAQRFGSMAPGEEHIAKRILRRDAESALRAYLTQPFAADPRPVREFKTFAAQHWGDWGALFAAAPRPSNYRSVLTYLRDHPTGDPEQRALHFRKALNLITRRLLSIYLAAYQSWLWNRIAGRYLAAHLPGTVPQIDIAGEMLPVYHSLPDAFERDIAIDLPNHRATYHGPLLGAIAAQVLAQEGLELRDLKTRILKKAYMTKGRRALLLFPQGMLAGGEEPDERFPGHYKLRLEFALPRGSYATLVLKVLDI